MIIPDEVVYSSNGYDQVKHLDLDENQKLQRIQNGCCINYDPSKEIKIKVLVDNNFISFVNVKLGFKITYLMTLFSNNNVLFTKEGYIINPNRTFGNFGFNDNEKVEVISFQPGRQVPLKNELDWTKLSNLSEETRVRTIYQSYLCSEMARINDIRFKKVKKINISKFKRIGNSTTRRQIEQHQPAKTVVPDPSTSMQCDPLPFVFYND